MRTESKRRTLEIAKQNEKKNKREREECQRSEKAENMKIPIFSRSHTLALRSAHSLEPAAEAHKSSAEKLSGSRSKEWRYSLVYTRQTTNGGVEREKIFFVHAPNRK